MARGRITKRKHLQEKEPDVTSEQLKDEDEDSPGQSPLAHHNRDGGSPDQSSSHEPPLLTNKDAKVLESVFEQVMASNQGRKAPRRVESEKEEESGTSPSSSKTNAAYRRNNLAGANISLHADPPDDVEEAVSGILKTKIHQEHRATIDNIARRFHEDCLQMVRNDCPEAACLDALSSAIRSLPLKDVCVGKDAAWRAELRPLTRYPGRIQSAGSGDSLSDVPSPPPPRKRCRRQKKASSSESSVPAAVVPKASNGVPTISFPIKTPQPDLFLGISRDTITSAVSSSRGISNHEASIFLDSMEHKLVHREPGRPLEPKLLVVPSDRFLKITFPFLVVEGKGYSTGRQIYEAENQAATASACAHKMLLDLDSLASSRPKRNAQPRVIFAITTQGPIHELWVQWTVADSGGERLFESKLCNSWNGLVSADADAFLAMLYRICAWGKGPFTDSVTTRMVKVAAKEYRKK